MMETILCPYCECKVNMNDVDDEGGVCPECGALITGSMLYAQEDDLDGHPGEEEGGEPGLGEGVDDLDDDFRPPRRRHRE
jgi:hypothetical protein